MSEIIAPSHGEIGGALGVGSSQEVVYAEAHEAVSKGNAYFLTCGSYGFKTKAIPSAEKGTVIVALEDIASGSVGRFCRRGLCTAKVAGTIAAGYGCEADTTNTNYLDCTGSSFSGNVGAYDCDDCAVVIVAGTSGEADTLIFLPGSICVSTS